MQIQDTWIEQAGSARILLHTWLHNHIAVPDIACLVKKTQATQGLAKALEAASWCFRNICIDTALVSTQMHAL